MSPFASFVFLNDHKFLFSLYELFKQYSDIVGKVGVMERSCVLWDRTALLWLHTCIMIHRPSLCLCQLRDLLTYPYAKSLENYCFCKRLIVALSLSLNPRCRNITGLNNVVSRCMLPTKRRPR